MLNYSGGWEQPLTRNHSLSLESNTKLSHYSGIYSIVARTRKALRFNRHYATIHSAVVDEWGSLLRTHPLAGLALELGGAAQLDIPTAERVNFNEVNAIVFTIIYAAL